MTRSYYGTPHEGETFDSPTFHDRWGSHPDLDVLRGVTTSGKYTEVEALGLAVAFLVEVLEDLSDDCPALAITNAEAEIQDALGPAFDRASVGEEER